MTNSSSDQVTPDMLPEVFFSGNLHGNEEVGPPTLVALGHLLLENADDNEWIRFLLETRRIVMLPVSNALGYDNHVREENGVDPNRDFPYRTSNCMQTIVARSLNEIFREHLFQLAVTFHGGMRAIAYEWGAPNHQYPTSESPDDAAQKLVGGILRDFAGSYTGKYPVDRLNDLVYPVNGGMEDWAYAASWDKTATTSCQTSAYNGYPITKTSYSNSMLRAINILVETADRKQPYQATLGTDAQLLTVDGQGDGHVPRNVRLALALIDMLQPYLVWQKPLAGAVAIPDGFQPLQFRTAAAVAAPAAPTVADSLVMGVRTATGRRILSCAHSLDSLSDRRHRQTEGEPFPAPTRESYNAVVELGSEDLTDNGRALELFVGGSWDVGGAVHVDMTELLAIRWPTDIDPRVLRSESMYWEWIESTDRRREMEGWVWTEESLHRALQSMDDIHYVSAIRAVLDGTMATEELSFIKPVAESVPENGPTRWAQYGTDFTKLNMAQTPFQPRFSGGLSVKASLSGDADSPQWMWDGFRPHRRQQTDSARLNRHLRHKPTQQQQQQQQASSRRADAEGDLPSAALLVVPVARVDSSFKNQQSPLPAGLPPQSHYVNARTKVGWNHEVANSRIVGRVFWFAAPISIAVYAPATAPAAASPSPSTNPVSTATASASAATQVVVSPTSAASAASTEPEPAATTVASTTSTATAPAPGPALNPSSSASFPPASATSSPASSPSSAADSSQPGTVTEPAASGPDLDPLSAAMLTLIVLVLGGMVVYAVMRQWRRMVGQQRRQRYARMNPDSSGVELPEVEGDRYRDGVESDSDEDSSSGEGQGGEPAALDAREQAAGELLGSAGEAGVGTALSAASVSEDSFSEASLESGVAAHRPAISFADRL